MNKYEREKLHSVLTRIADRLEGIEQTQVRLAEKLDAVEASQVVLGAMHVENETDIKNLLLVCQETQQQLFGHPKPNLKAVKDERPPPR